MQKELPILMGHSAGMCRGQKTLDDAIAQVENWREQLTTLPLSQTILNLESGKTLNFSLSNAYNFDLRTSTQTYSLLALVCYLILKSAAFRIESRGGNYRLEYPLSDIDWCSHTLVRLIVAANPLVSGIRKRQNI